MYTIEKLEDLPAILVTYASDYDPVAEVNDVAREGAEIAAGIEGDVVFFLNDVSQLDLEANGYIDGMVEGFNEEQKSVHDPRMRIIMCGRDPLLQHVKHVLAHDDNAGHQVLIMETLEEAIAYVRSQV